MEILLFFVLLYAGKRAWDDTWKAWGKSREAYMKRAGAKFPGMSGGRRAGHALRHDLGYGASQVRHGFPNARHGFAAGWHEGRQAHAQARAGRERAKTGHLETRARLMPELSGYRKRQQAALAQIRASGTAEESEEAPRPEEGSEGSPAAGRTYSYGNAAQPLAWPTDDPEVAHGYAQAMSAEGATWLVHEYPPGDPQPGKLIATYRNGKQPADCDLCGQPLPAGYAGIAHPACIDAREREQGEGSPEGTSPDLETTPSPAPAEGSNGMSDTTYDGVIKQMESVRDAEENSLADRANSTRQANSAADDMQALDVDPATLSAMADHLDAQQEAEKAQQKVMETAGSVKDALERGHRDLNEAHQNAPVQAADKQFYGEG